MLTTKPIRILGPRASGQISQSRKGWEIALILLFALVHVPLGLILYGTANSLAIAHPAAVFVGGMYLALRKDYGLERVVLVVGYIVGSEVLWRMAKVPVYWEFGKYAIAAIMISALLVRRRLNIPALPLIYGVLLIPACFLTLTVYDLEAARGFISADLSGPLALIVACWFFSKTKLGVIELRRLLYVVLAPLLSVAFVTLFFTVSTEDIQFTTESNYATSGGFGPNQVSSMLGFGAFIATACIVLFRGSLLLKAVLGGLVLFFAAQSVMTFSRGGIYNAVGALAVLTLFHFRSFTEALKRLVPIGILVLSFFWFVLPTLNDVTSGKLEERFRETNTTNRLEIVTSDLEIFKENPIFGVGVGVSRSYRERFLTYGATSHTEFARLISDHGSLGLTALIVLFIMTVVNFKRSRSTLHRALVTGISAWSLLYMLNAGMRLAAPSFLWGMTFVTIVGSRRLRQLIQGTRAPSPLPALFVPYPTQASTES